MGKFVAATILLACCACGEPAPGPPPESKTVVHPRPQGPAFHVTVELEGEPQPVSIDHRFRNSQRFRFLIQPAEDLYFYVFYRDESRALSVLQAESASGADTVLVQAPQGDSFWLRMDENPGTEHFLILASQDPLPQLDFGRDTIPAGYLDNELEAMRQSQGLSEAVKSNQTYHWPPSAKPGQALLAEIPLEHR